MTSHPDGQGLGDSTRVSNCIGFSRYRVLGAIAALVGLLMTADPVDAQFAYRTNTRPDTYSIIDWTARSNPQAAPLVTDLELPTGCLLVLNGSCVPVVDSDPISRLRLPVMKLLLKRDRAYYVEYLIVDTPTPVVPRFMVSIIDTRPAKPVVLQTIPFRIFMDAIRTSDGRRIFALPVDLRPLLWVYDFPCSGPFTCVPTIVDLTSIGPNQITLLPLSLALSEDEGTLWVAGVDANTRAGGGIVVVDTGGSKPGSVRKTQAFIPCPELGPMCYPN